MTIDEAIRISDKAQGERTYRWASTFMRAEFYALCGDALRLAKKMSEETGLTEECNPAEMRKAENATGKDMTANEYQRLAMRTATHKCYDLANAAPGLTGETGEVADIIKKHLYQGHDLFPSEVIEELAVCSVADAYGFGPERMKKFFVAFQENSDEIMRMEKEVDTDYAYEKLRLKAERVTGMKIEYMYEHEAQENEA